MTATKTAPDTIAIPGAGLSPVRVHANLQTAELIEHAAKKFSIAPDRAAEWVERFMRDLKNGLNKRSEA